MTGHCAPACHCHCATSSVTVPVNVMSYYYPPTVSTSRSGGDGAAPLLVPKSKHKPDDVAFVNAGAWLGIGLAGLVVLAFVLVIIFRGWSARV